MTNQTEHYQNKLSYEMDSADLFEALDNGERIVVVDTRKPEGYAQEHIPGAISFPHRTMNEESARHLDKGVLYVTYCDGIGCNGSTKGALKLSMLGFKVKELMGGLDWWKRDEYATEGLAGASRKTAIKCFC